MTSTTKKKAEDAVFDAAYKKLGEKITAAETVTDLVNLCNTLAKMKQVQMKGDDEGFGGGLGGE